VELSGDALRHKRYIGVSAPAQRRRLRQHVAGVERTSRPSDPAEEDVAVSVQRIQLLAHIGQAARVGRPTTSLGEERLALVGAQVRGQGVEGGDVVRRARGVRAGAVRVEVLVHVEDEVRGAAVQVGNGAQRGGGTVADELGGRGVVVAREEDLVRSGTGVADGCDAVVRIGWLESDTVVFREA